MVDQFAVCEAEDNSGGGSRPARDAHKPAKPAKPPKCVTRKLEGAPEGSEVWVGHDSSDKGAVYVRDCSRSGGEATPVWVPEGTAVPAVDPRVVAQQAVSKMRLDGPKVASPTASGRYVVGVPMWLWVDKSPTTFGPNTTSATAGGVTVSATATVSKIVWAMGDGTSVTCNGPGTPYTASAGSQQSPTCGHVYKATSAQAPGGKFAVSATATWDVDWQVAGGGETGQFTEVRQSQVDVAIGEVQVVG